VLVSGGLSSRSRRGAAGSSSAARRNEPTDSEESDATVADLTFGAERTSTPIPPGKLLSYHFALPFTYMPSPFALAFTSESTQIAHHFRRHQPSSAKRPCQCGGVRRRHVRLCRFVHAAQHPCVARQHVPPRPLGHPHASPADAGLVLQGLRFA
jgi:hypothetical protein